jgi:surface protein
MKNYLLLVLSLFSFFHVQAQQPFITTWEVTAGDLEIMIPTNTFFYSYDYSVDFGDGTVLNNQVEDVFHIYQSPGVYTVSISGNFPQFYGNELNTINIHNKDYTSKLQTVEQWGDIIWLDMYSMFSSCENLVLNCSDTPILYQVENLGRMFKGAESFNQDISNWDVSNIKNMGGIFWNAISFNQPIESWNTSSVTNMNRMFQGAISFNQPLNNLFVSYVEDMSWMFNNAVTFNQPLNNWNVSNVESMGGMFTNAISFNQPLNNWNVSNVVGLDEMFYGAEAFNQPLNNWDVSNVVGMGGMFRNAVSFNQPLNNWDVSSVIYMSNMFTGAELFNQALNNWDVSNVEWMYGMFSNATNFNQELSTWDVSNVLHLGHMFDGATAFNKPLNNWDVSNVDEFFGFEFIFRNASSFNQDLSSWNFQLGNLEGILDNSGLSVDNYDLLIEKLVLLNIDNGILGAENIQYCNATQRQQLLDAGWNITDAGQDADCVLNVDTFDFNQIKIYPNPVSDQLYIDLPNRLNLNSIELYDIQGKLIKSFDHQTRLDFNDIQKGVYILKLETDQGSFHHKVIKQ